MTVLQSAAGALEGSFAAFAAVVVGDVVFAAVVVLAGGHTPLIVNTAASGGSDADLSGAAGGAWTAAGFPGAWLGCADGGFCPHAKAPSNTHSSQLLRINRFLQDCLVQKVRSPKHEILAHDVPVAAQE